MGRLEHPNEDGSDGRIVLDQGDSSHGNVRL